MQYHIIRVPDIPSGGKSIEATTETDEWFKKIASEAFSKKVSSLIGRLSARVTKIGRSVEIVGGVFLSSDVECDRCLSEYRFEQQIPFRMILEPAPKVESAGECDDEEDMNEALDFSYYNGDEVDFGDLLRQHILMSQPISHVCRDDCKGLCPKCGKDLNRDLCDCDAKGDKSPFAVAMRLKPRA